MQQCSNCKDIKFKELFKAKNPDTDDSFEIAACETCGLKTTIKPENLDLEPYYTQTNYYAKKKSIFNAFKAFFAQIIKVKPFEKNLKRKNGRILDIGCGDGEFLALLDSKRWDLFGLEPFGKQSEDKKNIKIRNERFEETKYEDNYFDVLTMWHVFEHVTNPDEVLSECRRIIRDKGTLFMSIPNGGSFGFRIFRDKWFALYPPIHINHYDIESAKSILERNGFKVYKVQRFVPEYTPFVLLQSLQNSLGILPPNYLYKFLRGNTKNTTQNFLSLLLIPFLLPALMVLLVVELSDINGSSVISLFAQEQR